MDEPGPRILVIAGPNGSGKTTCTSSYLPSGMAYVNADEIAEDRPGHPSPFIDIPAGRIALTMMEDCERRMEGFAVATTLATRSLASRISRPRRPGYHCRLVFVWAPGVDF